MTSRIDAALERARSQFTRLPAANVPGALARGAVLVDIRPAAQRADEGDVPAALVIERNVLEGYTSSLAAAALVELGLHRATDVVGGYRALHSLGVLQRLV